MRILNSSRCKLCQNKLDDDCNTKFFEWWIFVSWTKQAFDYHTTATKILKPRPKARKRSDSPRSPNRAISSTIRSISASSLVIFPCVAVHLNLMLKDEPAVDLKIAVVHWTRAIVRKSHLDWPAAGRSWHEIVVDGRTRPGLRSTMLLLC